MQYSIPASSLPVARFPRYESRNLPGRFMRDTQPDRVEAAGPCRGMPNEIAVRHPPGLFASKGGTQVIDLDLGTRPANPPQRSIGAIDLLKHEGWLFSDKTG